jgi:hypothetical protein
MKSSEYTHPVINEEIASISGRYAFTKEGSLAYGGREILYLTGYSMTDSACCGMGGCVFTLVPGFMVRNRFKKADDGRDVSEVEPIKDEGLREEIAGLIRKSEPSNQVNFL